VDDFLILTTTEWYDVNLISQVFHAAGRGLKFTVEESTNNHLQFLDLNICSTSSGVCWKNHQRSIKPILPYDSHHSGSVKRAIIPNSLIAAIEKSCECLVFDSIQHQCDKLMRAGYPDAEILRRKQMLLTNKRTKQDSERDVCSKRVSIPYFHGFTNRIGKLARQQDVMVTSSYNNHLKSIIVSVDNLYSKPKVKKLCSTEHPNIDSFPCKTGIVYSFDMTCGGKYIGESGRCPNVRLGEHMDNIKMKNRNTYTTLRDHVSNCGCSIDHSSCKLFSSGIHGGFARKVLEGIKIEDHQNIGANVISQKTISPTSGERRFVTNVPKLFVQ
jgi:hypothetical protein